MLPNCSRRLNRHFHCLLDLPLNFSLLFLLLIVFSTQVVAAAAKSESSKAPTLTTYGYRVVETFPHSRTHFTQGLEFHDGLLYESTGLYGQSQLLVRPLASSMPLKKQQLSRRLFAEGITLLDDKIYQLTWKSGRVLVYDRTTLKPVQEFRIRGEGWGLTNNGRELIMSDGSDQLYFVDPENFSISRSLKVTANGRALHYLNELEWVNGQIYANIWQRDAIAIIAPETGTVVGWINLHNLLPKPLHHRNTDVLNGIAYDKNQHRLLVTGKNWPLIFHIELTPNPH